MWRSPDCSASPSCDLLACIGDGLCVGDSGAPCGKPAARVPPGGEPGPPEAGTPAGSMPPNAAADSDWLRGTVAAVGEAAAEMPAEGGTLPPLAAAGWDAALHSAAFSLAFSGAPPGPLVLASAAICSDSMRARV